MNALTKYEKIMLELKMNQIIIMADTLIVTAMLTNDIDTVNNCEKTIKAVREKIYSITDAITD